MKARDITYTAGPPAGGRSDWAVRAEMLLPSMRLSDIGLSLGDPGSGAGITASGHAGDEQLSGRELLPVCRHLLWPGEIE